MSKPNILLFLVDQLTSFVLSPYGGKTCQTPNIDALAKEGIVFEKAFCAYPLCAPSRCGLMSGRLPSRVGAFDNGAEFPASVPTFAHYLRAAGYYTSISGKMHFVGPDQFHGFEERLTPEIYPADMSWTPEPGFPDTAKGPDDEPDFGVSTIDTVKDAGPVCSSMQIEYDEDVTRQAIREIYSHKRRADGRPLMLTVSLTQPHDPYVTTQAFWDLYRDADIAAPDVAHISLEDRDPHSQSLYFHYGQHKHRISENDYRNARRGYFGMISHIDQLFGQIMEALRISGLDANTVVIFSSDHGDMIGERGMWFKKTLYNPAIRVPLIIFCPEFAGSRVSSPVSLIDIFPTLLDLAGIRSDEVTTGIDGKSLLPALRDGMVEGPVFCEHIDGGTAAPRVCVIDGHRKLVYSRAYPTQFYDLAADPFETTNLAGQEHPDEARLVKLAEETWPLDELPETVIRSQAERKLVDRALATGREERWDFETRNPRLAGNYVRRGDTFPEVERRAYVKLAPSE